MKFLSGNTAEVAVLFVVLGCAVVGGFPTGRDDHTFEMLSSKQEVRDGNSRIHGNVIASTFDDGTVSGHSNIGKFDVEAGPNGGMLGACAFDGGMAAHGVGINAKICVDTGAQARNGNVEVKLLGVGGKVGKDGIEVCLVFCIGVNWG